MRKLGRPFIWLRRFRHRCGYGVHSPFAFDFITQVIYEKSAYYAYSELDQLKSAEDHHFPFSLSSQRWQKLDRLLFRLVNRIQPTTIIDAGIPSCTAYYLRAARRGAVYMSVTDAAEFSFAPGEPVDFLYLHYSRQPDFVREMFYKCILHATSRTVFVVKGINSSPAMKKLWKQFCDDSRTGISFDLYYLGILFFDHSKIKQHYKVNF